MPKPVPDGGVVPAHLANATNHNISLDMRWCSCKKTQSVTIARDCRYFVQFFAIAAALIDKRSDFYSRPLLSSLSCKAQPSLGGHLGRDSSSSDDDAGLTGRLPFPNLGFPPHCMCSTTAPDSKGSKSAVDDGLSSIAQSPSGRCADGACNSRARPILTSLGSGPG